MTHPVNSSNITLMITWPVINKKPLVLGKKHVPLRAAMQKDLRLSLKQQTDFWFIPSNTGQEMWEETFLFLRSFTSFIFLFKNLRYALHAKCHLVSFHWSDGLRSPPLTHSKMVNVQGVDWRHTCADDKQLFSLTWRLRVNPPAVPSEALCSEHSAAKDLRAETDIPFSFWA